MAPPFHALDRIDANTLTRARQYVRDGRVLGLTPDEHGEQGVVVGEVQGTERRPYTCVLRTEPSEDGPYARLVQSSCTCPVGSLCKHAVACYLVLQLRMPERMLTQAAALPPARSPTASPQAAPMVSPDAWLAAATEALRYASVPQTSMPYYGYGAQHRIIYVLDVMQQAKLGLMPRLTLWRGLLSGDGTYTRLTPMREIKTQVMMTEDERAFDLMDDILAAVPYGATVVDAADAGANAWQTRSPEDRQVSFVLRGPIAARALQAVAQTGRLRFGTHDGAALRPAAPRRGALCWQRDARQAQRLTLALSPPAHFALLEDVPYFIDPADNAIGRILTDVDPELLVRIAHAPPIDPERAASFAASIPAALAAQLPAPEVLPVRELTSAPKVRVHVRQASHSGDPKRMLGELSYEYNGVAVSADATENSFYTRDDTGITRIKRQRKLERAAHSAFVKASGIKQPVRNTQVDLGPADDKQAFYAMSEKVLMPLAEQGWDIDNAPGTQTRVLEADVNPDAAMQTSARGGWFELEMGIVVDNRRVSLPPILLRVLSDPAWGLNTAALNASGRKHVFIPISDEDVVSMPTDRITDLIGMLESLGDTAEVQKDGVIRLPLSDAHLLVDLQRRDKLNLRLPDGFAKLADALRDSAHPPAATPPKDLQATLRPYQLTGLSWLQMLRTHALGGILADDMGLGKTLQTLAHILAEHAAGRLAHKALIVCPTSVLGTWLEAAARFTPTLKIRMHHGPQRGFVDRDDFDMLLTTYGTLLRDDAILAATPWAIFVLDEAQMVKNALSKSYIAACRISAAQHIALTGTPLENGLRELWALTNWAMPGLLGTRRQFEVQFVKPIETDADVNRRSTLVGRLRPFLLRRAKAQVMQELPDKTDILEHVQFGQKQRDLYEVVRASLDKKVRASIAEQGMSRSMLTVLDALLKLRQVCCDPRLLTGIKVPKNCKSAKFERLFALLPDLIESGRRILIFSQFTSMLDLIAAELARFDIAHLTLTGKTRKRDTVIDAFRTGHAPIFLISLKAGGTGLNLPEADTVIHYDPWWNPAAEDQATSRAHRMGQKKAVFVYKLVIEGSLEAKILDMQSRKRSLFAALLEGQALAGKLTEGDIDNLLAPLG